MSDARDELRAAIDGLSEEQARTLAGWAGMVSRQPRARAGERSVGPLGDALGITSELQEGGRCRMRLQVDPGWHNPHGVVHGGVVYTLIDYSMGGAVTSALTAGQHCTSIEVKVSYLASVREGTLTVDSSVVKQGRNVAFVESKVTDDAGRLVATGSGSMFIFGGEPKESA